LRACHALAGDLIRRFTSPTSIAKLLPPTLKSINRRDDLTMDVAKRQAGTHIEVTVTGRLDAQSANRLSEELAALVRGGSRHFRLDLAEVGFMSSAGLRILLQYYKQLKGMQGSLMVSQASAPVKMVMALAGFEELLGMAPAASPKAKSTEKSVSDQGRVTLLERGGATFEVFERAPYATLTCRVIGDPDALKRSRFSPGHCRVMQFPDSTFAVGVGAFGHDFQDCQNRFGEFLAAAGAVASQPTDGTTDFPDYQIQTGAFLPDVQVLDCLVCEGAFSHFIRFEAGSGRGTVRLADLVESCLVIARADLAGLIIVADTARLAGLALTGSPAAGTEAGHEPSRHMGGEGVRFPTLIAGIAARADRPALDHLLRPLGERTWPTGLLHAVAFSPHTLEKGEIELRETVSGLFEGASLRQIIHLLGDERNETGAGHSELVRGACWIAPIAEVVVERPGA
jgi:anti-anti-sigma factor